MDKNGRISTIKSLTKELRSVCDLDTSKIRFSIFDLTFRGAFRSTIKLSTKLIAKKFFWPYFRFNFIGK